MKHIKKAISSSFAAVLILSVAYFVFEPAIIKAVGDTAIVSQAVTEEITITSPDDTSLTPSIPGITGNYQNPSTASLTWTVKTSNATGFNMKIKASQTNALYLDGTYYFSDYSPASPGVPDYSWTSPSAAAAEFGFTVEPATAADTVQTFLDNASNACNEASGSQTAGKCWLNINGSTDTDMINRTTNTDLNGEAEVVKFQAESRAKFLKEGSYAATITVTAAMN